MLVLPESCPGKIDWSELSDPGGNVPDMPDATPTPRELLEFETQFFLHYGAKVAAIREEFGISDVRYFQMLREVVLDPPVELAVEFGPLINRTRRRMEVRQHQRAS